VSHGFDADLPLDALGDFDGLATSATPGPIGNRHKGWGELLQGFDGLEERIRSRVILGREKLEREDKLVFIE